MEPSARSGCAISAAVEVLGDPWAIIVLRDIMFGNRRQCAAGHGRARQLGLAYRDGVR